MKRLVCVLTLLVLAPGARAQPDPTPPADAEEPATATATTAPVADDAKPATMETASATPVAEDARPATTDWSDPALAEVPVDSLQIHGWASQGAMVSTGNNYLAHTKRGSFELFDAGVNVTKELASDIRAGMQIFAQDLGPIGNYNPIIDWAYIDYRPRPWLGVRAGHFKMPLYLYSDQLDADMTRTSVLMPQAVYDQHYRDVLAAVSGFAVYGHVELASAGALDYDVYGGTLFIQPRGSEYDVESLAGTRVVWQTPIPCVRAAGHLLYGNFHENYPLDAATVDAVQMSGGAPADWDGSMTVDYNHWTMSGGGLACETEKLSLTAEASLWHSSLSFNPALDAPITFSELRAYAQATYHVTDRVSTSLYASILRSGTGGRDPSEASNHQYDGAASVRYDVTPNVLVKAEAHAIDGYAATESDLNRGMERVARWGLFLVKTTLTF